MIDRKEYMRQVYPKYWLGARGKKYGFSSYDQNLCDLILELTHLNGGDKLACDARNRLCLLEVAIGTGYPFAQFFDKKDFSVWGVDIAPDLIKKCNELYPTIQSSVGDAEALTYTNNFFDLSYCFHATWYFPNLKEAIYEMIRVTKPGGHVLFDIQNRNNPLIDNLYRKNCLELNGVRRIKRYVRNIVKVILRKGFPEWHFISYEVPVYMQDVRQYLLECPFRHNFTCYARKDDGTLVDVGKSSNCPEYGRIVYAIKKDK